MTALQISPTMLEAVVPTITPNTAANSNSTTPKAKSAKVMNRIREVRQKQGISLRTVSRHMHIEMREIRAQEESTADLKLSDLYRWQQVLEVPVAELLVEEHDPLSRPVMERAHMLRVMKTAQSILEKANTPGLRRLSQMLIEQLTQIMPELEGVSPWHSVGQRRSLDDLGRIAEQPFTFGIISDDR
jgi:transcriptional regulator with XRE-family HTH domain